MRVAVDVTPLHDPPTGVRRFTEEIVRGLAARPGFDVVAYSASWQGRADVGGLVPAGVEVVSRPMAARPLRRAWSRFDAPAIEWWTGPVDAVVGTNFVVPPARRGARLAVVHDLTAWHFPELCTADTLRYPALVGRAVAGGAHVQTMSRFVAGEVVDVLGADPDRVHTVNLAPTPVGGGEAARGRELAGGGRYVLALGTIEPRKDLPLLVRAFDLVAGDDPDVRLVVAGPDGWGVAAYDAAVAVAAHRDRIVRLGWVDDAERADLLAGAAVFAYPSRYEGFGLPPLEAMTVGTPVVASTAGALPEVIGDAGLLVAPGDEGALGDAIHRVLTDAALRDGLVERGRRRAAGYTWEATVEGTATVLRSIVTS